jgi:RNA polymerase sigma-70 factor (ECF subfamily)
LDEVRQAIDALPHRQRIAVSMQRYKDLEYSEIADAMHCSTQTVKSLLFRAHNALRERLTNVHV